MFRLSFETGNAAFDDDAAGAVVGILGHIIECLEDGETEGQVLDENGNGIGKWELAVETRPEQTGDDPMPDA